MPSALSQRVCIEFQAQDEANCHYHGGNKAEFSEVQQAQEPCDRQSRSYIGCRWLEQWAIPLCWDGSEDSLFTAKDVLWMSGIVVGMTMKNEVTRCQPQHGELNQSTLTCSRAQHTRLSRKAGKFNKDRRSQRGVLHKVGLGKHARFLPSAKKSSLQSGSNQSGTKSLSYIP